MKKISKIIKYLVVNLTKEVKGLYTKNYKILMKEIEENTQKMKIYLMFMDIFMGPY